MIPMPPIQCVRLRQKIMDLGSTSISVKMDAPVVVKPETDSKNASVKEGIDAEKMYGKLPKTEKSNQESETTNPASFFVIFREFSLSCENKKGIAATANASNELKRNGFMGSAYKTATPEVKTNATDKINKLLAIILKFEIN